MATTDFSAMNEGRVKNWSREIWITGRANTFWLSQYTGMMSSGTADASKVVHQVTELTRTSKGDQVVMPLIQRLMSGGVVGDGKLTGKESAIASDYQTIRIGLLAKAVSNTGLLSDQRTVFDFVPAAKNSLSEWYADQMDELMFLTASGITYDKTLRGANVDPASEAANLQNLEFASDVKAPTSARIMYGGTAVSQGSLTGSDTLKWRDLLRLKTRATSQRVKPVNVNGRLSYIVVLNTQQAFDLKMDPDYRQVVQYAGIRGKDNPLFKGVFAEVDGLILCESERCYSTIDAPSGSKWGTGNVNGARALLLGGQSLGYASIEEPMFVKRKEDDYNREQAYGYNIMFGILKPQFKDPLNGNTRQDFSIIALDTAITNV
jgi:N4-gp56 family major capsid protein